MIRANLLPRPKERVLLLGLDIDVDYLRQAVVGLAIVVAVALLGIGIESLRLHRLEAAAADADAAIAAGAPARAESKRLALDVARYQEFSREARLYRRSGADAAVALARIGNTLPDRVWLDAMDHDAGGYRLTGGSHSVDALGGTILAIGRALPSARASLVNIDNHDAARNGVRFTARVAVPAETPR